MRKNKNFLFYCLTWDLAVLVFVVIVLVITKNLLSLLGLLALSAPAVIKVRAKCPKCGHKFTIRKEFDEDL